MAERKKSRERIAAEQLLRRIEKSPTAFHVIWNAAELLKEKGFEELREGEKWTLTAGGRYFVTRGSSSVIAFSLPKKEPVGYRIFASHSDSPTFKLKDAPELPENGYLRLNTEGYGGMLCAPWFDRPLSVAGRILVREGERLREELVSIDRDLLLLPSLAIHMNREANNGYKYNAQKDMLPVFGDEADKGHLRSLVAREAGVKEEEILGEDLFLYVRNPGCFWGEKEQFLSSPRLDDQECVWCSLDGFLEGKHPEEILTWCVFDNEEVGSETRQGAASSFLADTMERIGDVLMFSGEKKRRLQSGSFLVSADNAHAVHPAHIDKADPVHRPRMNGGIVLKFSARQKYTTDGVSAAVVRLLCEKEGIPLQNFWNRSDNPGGSTLGNIVSTRVSMNGADIGLAQLAMHSPYESAGVRDVLAMTRFAKAFYSAKTLGI